MISVLARAVTYSALFIGFLLVFLPGRVLERWGMIRPAHIGAIELLGVVVGVAGGALAIWCILTFAVIGRGTPAPFDPPRRLVIAGPYRYVRNPMYLGAVLRGTCSDQQFWRGVSGILRQSSPLASPDSRLAWTDSANQPSIL